MAAITVGRARRSVWGDYRSLLGDGATFGGTEAGASAEPVTYSYINTAADGTT